MNQIKVSVVMPVFNNIKTFKTALDSVQKQTLEDIEIIVVDYNSTDGTTEFVIKRMEEDSRIRLFQCKKNSVGAKFNLGIKEANGKYIGFCEGDDYLAPEMMESLYEKAKTNVYPDAVKAGFYFFFENNGGAFRLPYGIVPRERKDLYGKVISLDDCHDLYYRDINMWNGIYRKSFLQENNIFLNESDGAAFQDADFIQQVNVLAKRQMYVNEYYYHYRQSNDNSSIYKKTTTKFLLQEFYYMMDFMDKNPDIKRQYGHLMVNRMYSAVGGCYANDYYWDNIRENDMIEELKVFQKKLMEFIADLHNFISGISVFPWTNFQSVSNMCSLALNGYHMNNQRMYSLRNILIKQKAVVILGAGERGQSFYAFLVRNNYEGIVFFADNNKDTQGKLIMDIPVFSFEDACRCVPEGMYIMVNNEHFNGMLAQLLANGIKKHQIIMAPNIVPHNAMTVRWDMKPREDFMMG